MTDSPLIIKSKVFSLIVVVLIFGTVLSSCVIPADKVLDSLGRYKGHEFYTQGEFQDYTDYAKYYYDSVEGYFYYSLLEK